MPTVGDNPIDGPGDDRLGRVGLARVLAGEIRVLDPSRGFVVGLLGPWGSGKTSLINLMKAELAVDPVISVIDFNPWMVSGADHLVESFFLEVAAQLRGRSKQWTAIADGLETYSGVLAPLKHLPVVGPWTERVRSGASLLKKVRDARRLGIGAQRAKLTKQLAALQRPLVVVIDDIDRLTTGEIRDIFKLVRLTASFPNLIYVLAFDRRRVESALTDDGMPGRQYLEKILQLTFDIPAPPDGVLVKQLTHEIDAALASVDPTGPFDEAAWPDVLFEVVVPLLRNMRDVRRYVASLAGTFRDLDGNIAMVDVLGLEAVRVFLPDVFLEMYRSQRSLTTPSTGWGASRSEPASLKDGVLRLVEAGGAYEEVVRSMVQRLFPAAVRHLENNNYGADWQKRWLRERRVAHPDVLSLYLERVIGSGLVAFSAAEQAFALFGDERALEAHFNALDGVALEHAIEALEAYEGEYPPSGVESAVVVLLNQLDRIRERPRGMFEFDQRLVVTRVVLRLLRALPGPAEVDRVVTLALPKVHSLSSRFDLLRLVGHEEGVGHKLLTEAHAGGLERALRNDVRAQDPDDLVTERELLSLLIWTNRSRQQREKRLIVPASPRLDLALLRAAAGESRSQPMGSRAIHRKRTIAWDALVMALGSVNRPGSRGGSNL